MKRIVCILLLCLPAFAQLNNPPKTTGGTGATTSTQLSDSAQLVRYADVLATAIQGNLSSIVLRDVVSVKDCGAKGDNSTNDTTNIQTCLTNNAAKTVIFPAGTYLVSSPLEALGSVQLDPGATVKATATMAYMIGIGSSTPVKYASYSGGVLNGNALANIGWYFRQYQHLKGFNLTVKNCQVDGFKLADSTLTANGNNYEFIGQFLHYYRDTGTLQAGSAGLHMDTNETDGNISQSTFVDAEVGVNVQTGGNFFTDIHVWARQSQGWMVTGFDDYGDGNFWKGCEADTPQTYGLRSRSFRTVIEGCRFFNSNTYGTNGTAIAIHFDQTAPAAINIGNVFTGQVGAAWAQDFDSISATIASFANQLNNVNTPQAQLLKSTALIGNVYPGTYGGTVIKSTGNGYVDITNNNGVGLLGVRLGSASLSTWPGIFVDTTANNQIDFMDDSAAPDYTPISSGNHILQTKAAATSGASVNSPFSRWLGAYWNGSVTGNDYWNVQDVIAAGTNGSSTLTFTHTGSSGTATLNAPNLQSGGNITLNSGSGIFWGPRNKLTAPADGQYAFLTNSGANSAEIFVTALRSNTSSNTDLDGQITLVAGTGTYTFTKTYTSTPICVASDTTAVNAVKATATTTVLTLTGTGTDVINYICHGRN